MSRGLNRADRVREMERLYIQQAFTDIEMAARLEVDRTTVYKDRVAMETEVPFVEVETGRWKIDRTKYLSALRVNLHEALALYLATRRASRQTRMAQPHMASALEKLAAVLRQPMTARLVKAAGTVLAQAEQPARLAVVETIARGWVEQLKVQITHRALRARGERHYVVCPYLIEPSLWGEGAYLIGHSDVHGGLATFKIERIEQAALTRETFTIPETFDEQDLLKHAWGIWYGDEEPAPVRLRFAPGPATRRVKESIWHPTEEVTDTPDGGCLWTAQVAEWQEMLPWVRGWGAEVEVLEPEGLREALQREARRLAQLYQTAPIADTGPRYYAHSKEDADKSEWQRLIDHLNNTAKLAADLGRDAGLSELAQVAGQLHDIGKYSQEFQRRLEGSNQRVDHATAGAREITLLFQTEPQKTVAALLAYCIAGHHGGLPDYGSVLDVGGEGTLLARLDPAKTRLPDYSGYRTELNLAGLSLPERLSVRPSKQHVGFSVSFLTRMVYSALVDADWLETETYMQCGKKPRGAYDPIETLCERFNHFLKKFDNPESAINQKRTETLKACLGKSGEPQGIFTLTIPTGGGKTLASMAFALNHAVRHKLKRILYVIPFTSIIEQNAAVFKDSLGEVNVLEHHSNFDWEQVKRRASVQPSDDETNQAYDKLKLAAENWDIPVVVTTNVQFFESLFANQKSRCRKLHNLAKSVIIFDEAQMLPREYMKPCLLAVQELVQNYGVSAVFCTATQPVLKPFLPERPEFTELAPDPQALFDFYKRTQVRPVGKLPDEELLARMNAHPQALCIVNTRKHAKGLYDGLSEDGRFHLSTLMCPAHRKETLLTIRRRLNDGAACRVVSTQVMEAGIDVDFPVGYRALAGLDSVIQAAGRVNREGKRPSGEMLVFEPESEFIKRTPTYIKQTAEVARSILREFEADPTSMAAIRAYFQMLITLQEERAFDAKDVLACLDRMDGFDFKTAAEKFKLIEDNTVAVIIPYNAEAVTWVEELRYSPYPAAALRKLQGYTVNIYEREFQALNALGVIDLAAEAYAVLKNMDYYDAQTGIRLPASEGGAAVFYD